MFRAETHGTKRIVLHIKYRYISEQSCGTFQNSTMTTAADKDCSRLFVENNARSKNARLRSASNFKRRCLQDVRGPSRHAWGGSRTRPRPLMTAAGLATLRLLRLGNPGLPGKITDGGETPRQRLPVDGPGFRQLLQHLDLSMRAPMVVEQG